MFYVDALNEALREEMNRDPRVFIMGEDIGIMGGVFKVTKCLLEEFGEERVRQTPISEAGFIGAGLGAALTGMRPVVDLMFMDFIFIPGDQIFNQIAKLRYMTGGQVRIPLVIRTCIGAGRAAAAQHSQSLQAIVAHVPGLEVVLPSNGYDAKGLLKTAIRNDNPVIFLEHKFLYREECEVPEEEYTVPFGKAEVKTEGNDITIVATSRMVSKSINVASKLKEEGIGVEVIDLRTLVPYDRETVAKSVSKTGRLVVTDEGCIDYGVTAEIAMKVVEDVFYSLKAPIKRVAAPQVPVPFCPSLEKLCIPSEENIEAAVLEVLNN